MSIETTRFKHLSIVLGVPSTIQWFQKFASCYNNMVNYFHDHRVEQYRSQKLLTDSSVGSILPKQRMEILRYAKANDVDFLLWLDSDHTFPKSMIHRMVHVMLVNEIDVLAANCVTKRIPANPTARYHPKDGSPVYGEPCYTDEKSPELEKVWRVGTGVMMMSQKVIRALPLDCFSMFFRPEVESYQGEDWSMVEKLEELGFDIWVDHKLSAVVGHLGIFEFTHDHVGEIVREEITEKEEPRVVSAHA